MPRRVDGSLLQTVLLLAGLLACVACTSKATDAANLGCPSATGPGLELCLDFEGAAGAAVPDLSGHARDGVATDVTFPIEGSHGRVARFPGRATALVDLGEVGDLEGSLSVEAWLRPETDGKWAAAISNWTARTGFWLGGGLAPGAFEFYVDGLSIASSRVATLGAWTHVAGTYDATTGEVRLYVDGRLAEARVGVHPAGPLEASSVPLALGAGGDIFTAWAGDLDDVRLWSRVLPADEVCDHAGGSEALRGNCRDEGDPVGPASGDTPALVRLMDRLEAAAASGEPVDLDDDGYHELTQTTVNGKVVVDLDGDADGLVDLHEEWAADGSVWAWTDADADGLYEWETTIATGPERRSVTLRDANLDGIVDRRVTRTYDQANLRVLFEVEFDPDGDGEFELANRYYEGWSRRKTCCPCQSDCDPKDPKPVFEDSSKDCAGDTIPTPTDGEAASRGEHRWKRGNVTVLVTSDTGRSKDGACDLSQFDAIRKSLDCAVDRKNRCLSKANPRLAKAVDAGLGQPLDIWCGNRCDDVSSATATVMDGDGKVVGHRIGVNTDVLMKESAQGQCENMLHELIHAGEVHGDACHDCGTDDTYACARYCADCALADGKATQAEDCATCMDTRQKKQDVCGVRKQLEPLPVDTWGWGICHGTIGTDLDCSQVLGLATRTCDGLLLEEAAVCCQGCPSDAPKNDYPCGPEVRPAEEDGCKGKPKECP